MFILKLSQQKIGKRAFRCTLTAAAPLNRARNGNDISFLFVGVGFGEVKRQQVANVGSFFALR